MVDVVCEDGSVLSVLPVPVLDRGGVPYEAWLRLERDGAAFGEVGECSAAKLADTAALLREVRRAGGPDAFPDTGVETALRLLDGSSAAVRRVLPRDRELLALRAREPDDGASSGELRLWLRDERTWRRGADSAPGGWTVRSTAVLDAWGSAGTGVRCVLDSGRLLVLLDRLVEECVAVGGLDDDGPRALADSGRV